MQRCTFCGQDWWDSHVCTPPKGTLEKLMSMHKEPLTSMEREGLVKHGLPIAAPSQLSDSFRLGIRWALKSGYADHSHKCRACGLAYTPPEGASEDCPVCGSDGTTPIPLPSTTP